MNDAIQQRIIEIVAEQAEVDPSTIKSDSTLDDLGVASLTQIEILYSVEQAFDIDLPDRPEDPTPRGLSRLVADLIADKSRNA